MHPGRPQASFFQSGLTLVELLVSMTIGLIVVMAATALLLSSQRGYLAQDDDSRIDDAGRYAIESVSRAVRQAAYVNWDRAEAPIVATALSSPNIVGMDASRLSASTPGISSPSSLSINGSDVLALRYFGSGSGKHGDGTVINCAGFGVAAVQSPATADADRGWSIFYVAKDNAGETQLYCKYQGTTSWATAAIARGVESFQVLYGIDTDDDGLPNRIANATTVNDMDAKSIPAGAGAVKVSFWKKVVSVRIALLVRGASHGQAEAGDAVYDLFGKDYSDAHAEDDAGVHLSTGSFNKAVRRKARRIYVSTIQLRNHPAGEGV